MAGTGERAWAAALLNASGLGAGWVYLRRWRRARWYGAATLLLVIAATVLDASDNPGPWSAVYGVWLAAAAFDGWRLGRAAGAEASGSRRAVVAGLVAVCLVAAGIVYLRSVPRDELAAAEEAHRAGECGEALAHYERAGERAWDVLLSPEGDEARRGEESCGLVVDAEGDAARGDFEDAIADYERYLHRYGGHPPWGGGEDRLIGLRLAAADALADRAGDTGWSESGGYLDVFGAYFAVREDYPGSAGADAVPGRVEEVYEAVTAPLDEGLDCQAITDLRHLTRLPSSFDEPEARDLADRAEGSLTRALFGCGQARVEGDRDCSAAETFEEVLEVEGAPARTVARAENALAQAWFGCGQANQDSGEHCMAVRLFNRVLRTDDAPAETVRQADSALPDTRYRCGIEHYEDRDFYEATVQFQAIEEDYPGTAVAGRAADMLVITEIARANYDYGDSDGEEYVPEPPGTGGPPGGPATMVFLNDSPTSMDVLYTGPETGRATVDACAGCPSDASSSEHSACYTSDRPSATLTVPPGEYIVMIDYGGNPYTFTTELEPGDYDEDCYYVIGLD
ncbi:hypothetical protein [Streptomyces sp. 6N223]|uniref:hypothetical protein n=1 Tax=Streptomyces sp. 6N223 TaxID=3457412 RepID=UPI003FD53550